MERVLPVNRSARDGSATCLQRFLLLSLLLHVIFLWPWAFPLPLAGQADTFLSVSLSLIEPASSAPRQAAPVPPRETSPKKTSPSPSGKAAASEPAPTHASTDIPIAGTDSDSHPPAAASAEAQIEALLLSNLRRYFEYPLLAQQRGWQGMVWLSVTIKPDGAVEDVHVTRSSGYALLDRSAIASVRRVGHLAEAASWLNGRALELPLPVVYRLTN